MKGVLEQLPSDHYHCIVTSPPYWGLRSYCKADTPEKAYELGSEKTPAEYIAAQVAVFRECRRVLHPTGVLVVNIGDTYSTGGNGGGGKHRPPGEAKEAGWHTAPDDYQSGEPVGIPDMLKNALRADGWRHRDTVIWAKPAPMPASLAGWAWSKHQIKAKAGKTQSGGEGGRNERRREGTSYMDPSNNATWADCPGCPKCLPHGGYVLRRGQWRTTPSHEYCFTFVESDRYFADAARVKEPAAGATIARNQYSRVMDDPDEQYAVVHDHEFTGSTRNPRSVQTWGPEPCKFSHYAAFPSALPRFFIKAATSPKGCCPTCGIPWSPVVEKAASTMNIRVRDVAAGRVKSKGHKASDDEVNAYGQEQEGATRVLGYRPSCDCDDPRGPIADPVPCRVLDPYAGTGTTLQAALELGCEADGIELNPQYVQYAIERLSAYLVPKGQAPAVEAQPGPLFCGR